MLRSHVTSEVGSCFHRYMCLKLSMASTGKSLAVFPKWYSGWVNLVPSAVRKLTLPKTNSNKLTAKLDQRSITFVDVLFSGSSSREMTLRNFSGVSKSSGLWKRMTKGSPSSVSSYKHTHWAYTHQSLTSIRCTIVHTYTSKYQSSSYIHSHQSL